MAERPILIVGGRVLDPERELHRPPVADILIEGARITAIGAEATARADGAEIIDARGTLVAPGFVNAHCHSHDTLLRGLFEQLPLDLWGLTAFPFNWSPRSCEEIRIRTLLHGAECLRSGITTIQDMVTIVGFDLDHAHALASAYDEVGIDALVAPQFSDLSRATEIPVAETASAPGVGTGDDRRLAIDAIERGIIAILDQASAKGVSWALGPVQPQICSDELLARVVTLAQERNLRIFTHLYETRAEAVWARQSLSRDQGSMVRRLSRVGLAGPRLTIAHGVWIARAEIAELAARGVSLACNPVTNLKLLNGVAPVRCYADAGANIGLGCDNSSASDVQNPFQAMKLFAFAWGMQSDLGADGAAARAFKAATAGGARALGLDAEIGRIAPGFRANLVFIDLADPAWRPFNSAVRQLVYGETGRAVRRVMVGGRTVVRDGALATIDDAVLGGAAEEVRATIDRELRERLAISPDTVAEHLRSYRRAQSFPLDMDALHLSGRR